MGKIYKALPLILKIFKNFSKDFKFLWNHNEIWFVYKFLFIVYYLITFT